MAKMDAVLFDLDGTLLNSHDLILASMDYAVSTVLGKKLPEAQLMQYVGTPLDPQMLIFADGDEELGARLSAAYRQYNESVHDQRVKAYPGIDDALRQIQQAGIPMGVVTSKRHRLAQRGVEIIGLADYMQLLIGPDDFPAHKPDPGPVLEACRRMGVDPARCAYVGDSPFDMHAGVAAGCAAVGCTWGFFAREALEAEHPAHIINDPQQLVCIALG